MLEPILQVAPGSDPQTAVASLIKVADNVEVGRWIEFPNSVLMFLLVPGDPESGALYVLDRKHGTWYSVDFEDQQFGGYSVSQQPQRQPHLVAAETMTGQAAFIASAPKHRKAQVC
jgi:hypothetical protein